MISEKSTANIQYYNAMNKPVGTKIDFNYSETETEGADNVFAAIEGQINLLSDEMSESGSTKELEQASETDNGGYTQAEINEMINNPLGKLWILMIQNDYISYGGDILDKNNIDNINQNTTLIQPIMPFQLTDDWKLIFRPVIPINSFETVKSIDIGFEGEPQRNPFINVNFDRKTGLGDVVLWTALATNEMAQPPNVFGFGTTMMLDTASETELGTGQNSIGPMALAMRIDDDWIYGAVVQHWWSVNDDSDRNRVNLTDIQYIGRYRYSPDTNIGFSPNIRYNWEADGGERWSIPVGMGFDTMIKIGPVPTKVGIELYHYIEQADKFGPEWQVRLYFTPVIPSPSWTQKALF